MVSQITPTGTSCSRFSGGSAPTLASATYTVRNGRISKVTPGGFLYWVALTRAAGSDSAVISQSITTGNFSTLFGLGTTSAVFSSSCTSVSGATVTAASGNSSFTVQWNGASAGTYYIRLRLNTSAVKNKTAPNPSTVHYAFSTNGVTGSTSGIDLTR